jgi:transcriptional regulator with XRE-family HTH domain
MAKKKKPPVRRDKSTKVPGFGARLKELRAAAGLTQHQLADAAGVHRQYVPMLEADARCPSLAVSSRIAVALGCSLPDLLSPAGSKAKKSAS